MPLHGRRWRDLTLLTRTPDVRQAEHTSVVEDIRVWYDAEGADYRGPAEGILEEHGLKGKRLGIETDAYGLTGYNLKRVEAALDGCELVEASDLVSRLRVIKSAEIEYVREAARLADLSLDRAVEVAAPGVFEGDVLAALQGAIFEGGGDFPANEVIIGSDPRLLFRSAAGMRRMDPVDQLSLVGRLLQALSRGRCAPWLWARSPATSDISSPPFARRSRR